MMHSYHSNNNQHQPGFITMVVVSSMLMASTITTLFVGKSSVIEQKVYQSQNTTAQAFEAAEAGIEYAVNYLTKNKSTVVVDSNNDGDIDSQTVNGSIKTGSGYSITFSNPTNGNLNVLKVTSTGTSLDGGSQRKISFLVNFSSVLAPQAIPNVSMITKGKADMNGNSKITNYTQQTGLWTGKNSKLQGNSEVDTNTPNDAIKDNDSTLKNASDDALFANYFGQSMDTIKNYSVIESSNGNNLDGQLGKAFWITPSNGKLSLSGNTDVGSASKPVLLIVDGNLKISGNAEVKGFIFVIGNFDGKGNGKVDGAVVATGDMETSGNFEINYDYQILQNTSSELGTYAKIPGTWKDY